MMGVADTWRYAGSVLSFRVTSQPESLGMMLSRMIRSGSLSDDLSQRFLPVRGFLYLEAELAEHDVEEVEIDEFVVDDQNFPVSFIFMASSFSLRGPTPLSTL